MTESLSFKRKMRLMFWKHRRVGLLSLSVLMSLALVLIFVPSSITLIFLGVPLWVWLLYVGVIVVLLISLIID